MRVSIKFNIWTIRFKSEKKNIIYDKIHITANSSIQRWNEHMISNQRWTDVFVINHKLVFKNYAFV